MQKLLIVDDESIQRTLVKRFLTGKKLEIKEAADGPTALKMLNTEDFDLLLFDDMMPGMNGVDLLSNLRELKANPNSRVPAIAMTGKTGSDARYTYIRAGFAEYLKKPVDKEALIEAIRAQIGEDFLSDDDEKKKIKELDRGSGAKSSARALLSGGGGDSLSSTGAVNHLGGKKEHSEGSVTKIPGVPDWMSDLPDLDPELGVKRNGSAEGLLSAVRIFSNSAQSKADEIEDFYWRGDVKNYTIKVHALKSSAQIIGANDLASKAERLEIAGETGDYDTIKKENGDFLLDFRALARNLKEGLRNTSFTMDKSDDSKGKKRINRKVALLSSKEHVLVGGMENKLVESGVSVDRMPATLKDVGNWYTDAELYVCYMDEGIFEKNNEMLLYLRDLCIVEEKSLILIGTASEYQDAVKTIPENCVLKWYERPFDMEEFLRDVSRFFDNYGKQDVKKQILIIDDDEIYMEMVESWLSDSYQIVKANSGLQGIRWLAKNRPDLVLLDYEMPITNGPQLLAMMKSEVGTSSIPVMFLTGRQDRDSVMTGLNLKPEDYLLKTIDRNSLREKLEVFFKMRMLEKR